MQVPSIIIFIAPMVIAFLLTPFMSSVTHWVGMPFTYVFLAVSAIPINLLCLGVATKGFLIFYYYPWKIKRLTGKTVFVDMATPI
jgi:hypothetical protein